MCKRSGYPMPLADDGLAARPRLMAALRSLRLVSQRVLCGSLHPARLAVEPVFGAGAGDDVLGGPETRVCLGDPKLGPKRLDPPREGRRLGRLRRVRPFREAFPHFCSPRRRGVEFPADFRCRPHTFENDFAACGIPVLRKPEAGFEPATPRLQGECSDQLSYSGEREAIVAGALEASARTHENGLVDEHARDEVAKNEALFRDVNERVKEVGENHNLSTQDRWDFLCECGNAECMERISLTVEEYERVRADPVLFAVVPGHERPTVEIVVDTTGEYSLIRKKPGEDAIARSTDPRKD